MGFDTTQPTQVDGLAGYFVDPIFTVGDTIDGYTAPGILDGIGAFELNDATVRIYVNHELGATSGSTYELANGTALTGARVSYFDVDKTTFQIVDAGLAFDTIINRQGEIVDEASDLEFGGIQRLCSAQFVSANQFGFGRGFADNIFFTGEETSGGTEFALDVATNTLYAVPWMGRAAWESVTELDTGTTDKVALLIGDDRAPAPLIMYVGEKSTDLNAGFLERNGLANGKLYVWAANNGNLNPSTFNGTFESRDGQWVAIDYYRPDLAGTNGYDAAGFATQAKQDALATAAKAFFFSRPEDVSTNPADGTVAVMASTGRAELNQGDIWGVTYKIDTDFSASGDPLTANIKILYDGNDAGSKPGKPSLFTAPDFGLRSPDNLDWADDGFIYIQEDRSTTPSSLFGGISKEEASIWRLNPDTGELTRIAEIDRTAIPTGQTDSRPTDLGNWETSGILDVSTLFDQDPGSLFIFDVQAHSLTGSVITSNGLVEGGQLAFLVKNGVTIDTGNGKDLLIGLVSNDTLVGGNGKDTLDGGFGHDTYTGGNGADTFIIGPGRGKDVITDFGKGLDVIGLTGGVTFTDLKFSGHDIIFNNEVLATLTGVNTTTLKAKNFVVV